MNKLTPGIDCLSFEYHKDDGDISQRHVVKVDLQPNGNFLCLDTTELEEEQIKQIALLISKIKRNYLDAIYAATKGFGVQVKTFSPGKMKNVKTTTTAVLRDVEPVSGVCIKSST